MRTVLVLAALAAGSLACASTPARVPLIAEHDAVASLAGEWTGEYSSAETGRSGSIVFKLDATNEAAFGDVVMVPRGATQALPPPDRAGGAGVDARTPQVLTIRFVRIAGDSVSGTLEPYQSPDCSCILTTTFIGRVRGDRIAGTFTTRGEPGDAPRTGRWSVRRKAD